ncbi:MAG: hypothetical protein RMJ98_09445 [Myxococcales bacterium]|nr:hypothetical protein [Polyangiaceae bacterium]MDW8249511.1 hypothetical protein [Myxococcales bacterium]
MKRSVSFAWSAAFVTWLAASTARADIPPFCNDFAKHTDCAAADIGKGCPGGGTCTEIFCEGSVGDVSKVTKCISCNLVEIPDPDKVCSSGPSSFGKDCGDGGTCHKLPSWCASSGYVVCAKESQGAGGSGGSDQAGSGTAESNIAGSGDTGSSQGGSSTAGTSRPEASAPEEDNSNCSVSRVGRHGALVGLMLSLGALALLVDRQRRL